MFTWFFFNGDSFLFFILGSQTALGALPRAVYSHRPQSPSLVTPFSQDTDNGWLEPGFIIPVVKPQAFGMGHRVVAVWIAQVSHDPAEQVILTNQGRLTSTTGLPLSLHIQPPQQAQHDQCCRYDCELVSHQQLRSLPQATLEQDRTVFPLWISHIRQIVQESKICPCIMRTLKWQHKYWTSTKMSGDRVKNKKD